MLPAPSSVSHSRRGACSIMEYRRDTRFARRANKTAGRSARGGWTVRVTNARSKQAVVEWQTREKQHDAAAGQKLSLHIWQKRRRALVNAQSVKMNQRKFRCDVTNSVSGT